MLASGMLTHQAELTRTNLLYRCDTSEQTHRLYEYSQVLHNIRASPECAKKFSVEECDGYESAPPYTSFLKTLESDFRCSGFCYKANPLVAGAAPGPAPSKPAPSAAPGPAPAAPGPALSQHQITVTRTRRLSKHHHHVDKV